MKKGHLIFVVLLLSIVSVAEAHKINLFVDTDAETVEGEVYFTGGGAGKNIVVRALGTSGREIGQVVTDNEGQFKMDVRLDECLKIVARTQDGHRAEYVVNHRTASRPAESDPRAHQRHSISARDVVGGIGWIVGIAGIAFYVKARRDLAKSGNKE